LLKNVETLESQLEVLKERAGLSDICVTEKILANDVMQEVVHAQQLSVAKTQAAIAGFSVRLASIAQPMCLLHLPNSLMCYYLLCVASN
jgi:hypothetical protein